MKRVGIVLDDDLYKKAKLKSVQEDKTMKEYISELISKDVETKKEQTQ